MPSTPKLASIPAALRDLRRGKPVVVVDDAKRENEGDVQIPAVKANAKLINFMITHARGLVCVALPPERLQVLQLQPMVEQNSDPYQTDFSVSVNARSGVTTGISAFDRATTIKMLIDAKTRPQDLVRPGHVFPLRAKPGGVLQRAGHTEAAVDLAALAGFMPAGVTCEILNKNGTMARLPQLVQFAKQHQLKLVSIADLIAYRRKTDRTVRAVANAPIPTAYGTWQLIVFESTCEQVQHLALVKGDVAGKKNVLVRVHSECFTGDVLGSQRCDCGEQLHAAMQQIDEHGSGVILYLRQEGRGIGLVNKLHAYLLQDAGLDTVEANLKLGFAPDLRDYGTGAQILRELGLTTMQLLTNNPKKVVGLDGFGLRITKQIPIRIKSNSHNARYLKTKKDKLGHWL
ncbi:MAG: bifunctional 3,4-dihydroxy-2-butanone-4-phosphate synthase/GTP cyclohydrolase II [Candidatus Kerfeldbacteria bacterium]|nr:bifunctional 3,4-dihydroxy-2-butanone-4-phosphate synthase/GTP cyclohydrolase II [Candidatus Kerfeldbacteria bacterium]